MKKHPESHMDHGFTEAQWAHIFAKYADKTAFFIDTFELSEDLGTVTNELYGPSAGDEPVLEDHVFYAKRGTRTCDTRLTMQPKRPTRFVRVIAGPHEEKCDYCMGEGWTWTAGLSGPNAKFQVECVECKGTKVTKHACILYTAYGVASIDMPAAPKEVGDIAAQLEALPEDSTQESLEKRARLEAQLSEARIFWATHALAAS